MSKTYKDMASFMQTTRTSFNHDYYTHKGVWLGELKPKLLHKPRHQLTMVEALQECDTYPTMSEAFGSAKR